MLKRTKIDAIVCDFAEEATVWPDVSGAIQSMNMETGCPLLPIILLTESVGQLPDSTRFAYPHVERIVEKPVSVARLVGIVAEEIRDAASGYPEMHW